nr:hypothetical protein [Providencia sp. M-27]
MDNTRNRAWRRAKARINKSRDQLNSRLVDCYTPEKNWKQMYGRSEKMIRAAQLGMAYPQVSNIQLARISLEETHNNSWIFYSFAVKTNGVVQPLNRSGATMKVGSPVQRERAAMRGALLMRI